MPPNVNTRMLHRDTFNRRAKPSARLFRISLATTGYKKNPRAFTSECVCVCV